MRSRRRIRAGAVRLLPIVLVLGIAGACGDDDTARSDTATPSETTPSETTPSETTATTASRTTLNGAATSNAAPVASLAADSTTCTAFVEINELNQVTKTMTNEFTAKVLEIAASGQEGRVKALEAELDAYIQSFSKKSEVLLPKLLDAYSRLQVAQPQFATDLELIKRVSVKAIEVFGKIRGSDLDRLDEVIVEAVGGADAVAAGLATLKIDGFSRAACDVPFANS